MALKKIIPTSPNANLLKGVDMTPLKVGDWNNDLKAQIAAEVSTNATAIALKADIASPTFTGTVTIPTLKDLTPTLEVKTGNFTAAAGVEYVVNKADGAAIVLPAAAAGARVTIVLGITVTSNTTTITASAGDLLKGYAFLEKTDGANAKAYFAPDGTNDLIVTLNGTTTGGLIGDRIELVGISDTEWRVRAVLSHTGSAATPFS